MDSQHGTIRRRRIETVLIDLDDTLYAIEAVPRLMLERIEAYMRNQLGIPKDKVPEMSQHFYLNYGTTLAGLVADGHKIDYDDWHAHVHGTLPYADLFAAKDSATRELLKQIRVPKYIFTNADEDHAHKCLRLMGIADLFDGVITFESIQAAAVEAGMVHRGVPVVCKPHRPAFELALRLAGGASAASTAFLDDSMRNVAGGSAVGMYTVLVGRTGVGSAADAEVKSFLDIPHALPWLWEQLTKLDASVSAPQVVASDDALAATGTDSSSNSRQPRPSQDDIAGAAGQQQQLAALPVPS